MSYLCVVEYDLVKGGAAPHCGWEPAAPSIALLTLERVHVLILAAVRALRRQGRQVRTGTWHKQDLPVEGIA